MPSTRVWLGTAQVVREVRPFTVGGTVAAGSTVTLTAANGKAITFTASTASPADAAAGLVAAINASPEPEFKESVFTAGGAVVTATGPADGAPITFTPSAGGSGSPTFTAGSVTTGTGPRHFDNAANWSGGATPAAGDTAVIDESSGTPAVYYGLDQNAVTFGALRQSAGALGLPERNAAGYAEWRQRFFKVGGITNGVVVGGNAAGRGVTRLRLDANGAAFTTTVISTGTPDAADNAGQAVQVKGLAAGSVVNVTNGSAGLAVGAGEAATVDALRVAGGVVRGGPGLTLAALSQSGGDVGLANGVTGSATETGGKLTFTGGAVATVRCDGGALYWDSAAAVTTLLNVGSDGEVFFTRDLRARTVAACTLQAGAKLRDDFRTVTWTAGVVLDNCSLEEVTLNLGTHVTLTVAAGP